MSLTKDQRRPAHFHLFPKMSSRVPDRSNASSSSFIINNNCGHKSSHLLWNYAITRQCALPPQLAKQLVCLEHWTFSHTFGWVFQRTAGTRASFIQREARGIVAPLPLMKSKVEKFCFAFFSFSHFYVFSVCLLLVLPCAASCHGRELFWNEFNLI